MTLVEMMVAIAIAAVVMSFVMALFISSLINFAGLGNYAILTGQSRMSLAIMARELREASQVLAVESGSANSVKSITVTNAFGPWTVKFAWNPHDRTMIMEKADQTGKETEVRLTGCDSFDFKMFQRNPTNNWAFVPTIDVKECKLISMNWKCSRSILDRRINTENVVTAQVVLRNKP